MEVEFFSNVVSEEDTVEVYPEIDNFGVEGERCGICTDIVIDRGILDCCQHWFCFACIDSWANIINLCPLCQNQFQLITCVPVYDEIGGDKMDEDSDCRGDDWGVERKTNIISIPSYYIDENAVTCLDSDGCKIRGRSITYEENLTLDTSIACDSCDLWYHAFCVGFDPEGTKVDSWLCPRCLANGGQQRSHSQGTYSSGNHLNPKNAYKYSLSSTSAGKVCMGYGHVAKKPTGNCPSDRDIVTHCGIEQCMLDPDSCSPESKKFLQQGMNTTLSEPSDHSVKIDEPVVKIVLKPN